MPVQVVLGRCGDGLGLPIPSEVAARVGLTENDRVEIEISPDGRTLVVHRRRRFTLDELLADMTPDREHELEDDSFL
jgi:antitoxin MazE